MSQTFSPSTGKPYGLKRVCKVWEVARSSIYSKRTKSLNKRGPKPQIQDNKLLNMINDDLRRSPFKGEGHRKVHSCLKRKGIKIGRNRVLNVMRKNKLLSPNRSSYRIAKPHDGKITTDAPNIMRDSDGTKVKTVEDGWVWVFTVVEHWNTETSV